MRRSARAPPVGCRGGGNFINFMGERGVLYANCRPFAFKGMNWFGTEGDGRVLQGLDVHSLDWYFQFLANHSFNSVRLLFNHEAVLANEVVPRDRFSGSSNPELVGASYVEQFQHVARAAARRDVVVLVTAHRLSPSAWPGEGL